MPIFLFGLNFDSEQGSESFKFPTKLNYWKSFTNRTTKNWDANQPERQDVFLTSQCQFLPSFSGKQSDVNVEGSSWTKYFLIENVDILA